jgi:leader peptidase (prepilin peptidase)/N-methyltransferase
MTAALQFLLATALGLTVGSFLNVVIHRGPTRWGLVDGDDLGSLVTPGSYCPACRAPIPAVRLIPVLSWLLLGGRCEICMAPISARYPIVEAMGAANAILALGVFGWSASAVAFAVFGFCLIALAFIDFETGYLPNAITYPMIAIGVVAGIFGLIAPYRDAIIGAVSGYVSLQGIALLYKSLRGRQGMGEGDAKLLAAIGAFGGWTILPATVLIGAIATLAVALAQGKIAADRSLPFGPGLCVGGYVAILAACYFNVL